MTEKEYAAFEQDLAVLRSRNNALQRLPICRAVLNQWYELRADYLILGCLSNSDAIGRRIDAVYGYP
mgnify:CR=1 FL=1